MLTEKRAEKRGYRPPPLEIILNGPPENESSNDNRLAIVAIAMTSAITLYALTDSLVKFSSLILPSMYTLEAFRQAKLASEKKALRQVKLASKK